MSTTTTQNGDQNPYSASKFPNFRVSFPISPSTKGAGLFPLTERSICLVEVDRPKKYNSWTEEMFGEYARLWEAVEKDEAVRVVVLCGKGEHLCAGIDVGFLVGLGGDGGGDGERYYERVRGLRRKVGWLQECLGKGERSRKPFIVLLHGLCYGLALDLTSTADIRIATTTAKMSIKEIDLGITADLGVLSRIPKVTGNMSLLKMLAFTGRDFSAGEARELGLVSEVVEGGKEEGLRKALGLAKVIAEKSPSAVEGVKAVVNHQVGRTVEESLEFTAMWNAPALLGGDAKRAVGDFLGRTRRSKI